MSLKKVKDLVFLVVVFDEDTGIYINEFGILDYEAPVMKKGQESVRNILGMKIERPKHIFLNESMELQFIEEAVA